MRNLQRWGVVVKLRIMGFARSTVEEIKAAFEPDTTECLAVRVGHAKLGQGAEELLAERSDVRGNMGQLVCKSEGCIASCVLMQKRDGKVVIAGEDTASLVDPCELFQVVDVIIGARSEHTD